jgi:hypothetical protein
MMQKLPPWEAKTAAARAAMERWANAQLDIELETEIKATNQDCESREAFLRWLTETGPQIDAAERGNIQPLREKYAHIAKFIHLPPLGRGKKRKKPFKFEPLEAAVQDVTRIRGLWRKHYGRVKRGERNPPTAEAISARRWGVDEEAVISRLKNHPK